MKCLVTRKKENPSRRVRYEELSLALILVGLRKTLGAMASQKQINHTVPYGTGVFSNASQALRARLRSISPSGTDKPPFFDSLLG